LADIVADGLPTYVVTHQLQVESRTGKVRRSQTDVLTLYYATNHQKVKYQDHESQKRCQRGSFHSCECWLLLAAWFLFTI